MSKIDELIKTLCPQGVEYKAINQLFNMRNGYTPSKSNTEYWDNGSIPWFRLDDIRKNGRILSHSLQYITPLAVKNNKLFPANSIIISIIATIGEHALITKPFLANQQFTILTLKDDYSKLLNIKYIYYYFFIISKLCINNTNTASFPSVNMSIFKQFQIPIPPMEVQEEIVKVLDAFTNLEAQLKEELAARKKQYTYYRNALLSFKPDELENNPLKKLIQTLCPQDVEYKAINQLFNMRNGYTPSKSNTEYWDNGSIPWFRLDDIRKNGRVLSHSLQYITPLAVKNNKLFPANSIIISTSATIGEHALITKPFLANQRFTILDLKHEYISLLNIKYIYYYFFIISKLCINNTNTASFEAVNMDIFKQFQIPIPPLAVQEEIVRILDNFDALTNDISAGLPAEINARRQQYEYFRNKLLTFKEKNV